MRGIYIAVLKVGHILPNGRIYGPGVRFVLWLQGCDLACKGCWNQQFWSSVGGMEYDIEELITQILQANVEGITLLGGEPMQQANPVLKLILVLVVADPQNRQGQALLLNPQRNRHRLLLTKRFKHSLFLILIHIQS